MPLKTTWFGKAGYLTLLAIWSWAVPEPNPFNRFPLLTPGLGHHPVPEVIPARQS
jgi:hypothetical protein